MALDTEVPDPPALRGSSDPGDYDAVDEPEERIGDDVRRDELEGFLRAGAWEDAFDDWADRTYLTDAEFRAVREAGLLDELDFYWNQAAEDVGYRVPSIPEDQFDGREEFDADTVETVEEELDDLARTVSEVLENDYIHRGSEEFGYDWE
ncbi:hypothetical protein HTZ84_08170 [Haloterrigena sp. SYSU A558-1]|uniref:DUF7992 domain-containing protein n=1 Tax=Haloterrigena gelatinilytica TaxID=2741724 RepID=A0A8J8KI49_9EURY|nr:hypothetical protein [Haloterrigena gelatinilytica]NUB91889.1 hypothetical protein [Haloterrigena gelatinilytica]NUC72286.1 hypothetical protein [Haloterrigena gelatinilytica]